MTDQLQYLIFAATDGENAAKEGRFETAEAAAKEYDCTNAELFFFFKTAFNRQKRKMKN